MKAFARIGFVGFLVALALLITPSDTRAQNSHGCAWPIEWSAEGIGNWAIPDTYARWWVMPFDNYQTMTIKGTYPNARFFSIAAYNTNNLKMGAGLAGDLYDVQIAPDPGGGVNPFVESGRGNGTYTVVISRGSQTSGNAITVSSDFAWVVLRLYVPNPDPSLSGRTLMGGGPLPTISVTGKDGSQPVQPCSSVNRLADVNAFRQTLLPIELKGNEGTPSSDRLWFAPPTKPPDALLPNSDGKYMAMFPGEHYQPGRIIVLHGRAPGFPDTFNGSSIRLPSRGFRTVDLRYWSLCEVDGTMPLPMVACATDLTTNVEGGYYTVVISDDLLRPNWLKPDINWMPWGDEQYPKWLVFRQMLPAPDFPYSVQKAASSCGFNFNFPYLPDRTEVDTKGQCAQRVMGDYYPVAAWCDKSTFIEGGFRACLKE
jgi:hypothetical protein